MGLVRTWCVRRTPRTVLLCSLDFVRGLDENGAQCARNVTVSDVDPLYRVRAVRDALRNALTEPTNYTGS